MATKSFIEHRRDIAIEQAPANLEAAIALIDAAIADLIKVPGSLKALGELSRAAGKLEALKLYLTTEG